MKPFAIDDVKVLDLGLGRSIYSPEQLEEFARFQESQGTRRAFLAESAKRAYNTRVGGQWGSGLSDLATAHLIDAVGYHLVPMYRFIGPAATIALIVLFLVGIVRMLLDIVVMAVAIAKVRGSWEPSGEHCSKWPWLLCSGQWPRATTLVRRSPTR